METTTQVAIAGADGESPVAIELRQRRRLVDCIFEIAKAVPRSLTGPARRKLRHIGVSDQAVAVAHERGILTFLSADADWNREHMARAGLDDRVIRFVSIRPIVFASVERGALTSYHARRTTDECAYREVGRGSDPIIWRGEKPETAIVENPLEMLVMVSAGWCGHIVALPAGRWVPWWSKSRAVKCARHVFALDGQDADLPAPGTLLAEHLRLQLQGAAA